ncbi:myb/SANT-like DNA-binding domain-containing protein 4 [Crassostrea virginica]
MQTMEPQSTPSKRKPNWNAEETLALTNLVDENKHIIRGKLGPNLTSDLKNRTWQNIAQTISAMGLGPARSSLEVEKKWHNIFSKSKSQISEHRRTLSGTGGGPPPRPPRPLSTIAETVCSVVGDSPQDASSVPHTDLKWIMEELSYRKLQLEIEYLNLKIKKLKEE